MRHRYAGTAIALVVALALGSSACADEEPSPRVIRAGQADIQLPPGWTVTEEGAARPPGAGDGESAAAAPEGEDRPTGADVETGDDVPLATEDPRTTFFRAAAEFQQCLSERGTSFQGLPDQANPNSPTNDPAYIESLQTCAAKTNIIEALQAVQQAEAEMTPEEIEEQNEIYLLWRDCMIGRGWGIPEPTPDAEGRLFSISGAAQGGGPQIEAPPGKDLLTSDDMGECIEEASSE